MEANALAVPTGLATQFLEYEGLKNVVKDLAVARHGLDIGCKQRAGYSCAVKVSR